MKLQTYDLQQTPTIVLGIKEYALEMSRYEQNIVLAIIFN